MSKQSELGAQEKMRYISTAKITVCNERPGLGSTIVDEPPARVIVMEVHTRSVLKSRSPNLIFLISMLELLVSFTHLVVEYILS